MTEQSITKIKDLKDHEGATIEGVVMELADPKTITTKAGKEMSLQEATIEDDTGAIKLTLWEKDVNSIAQNNRIRLNGYVTMFKEEMRISKGKFGKIEVLPDATPDAQ